MPPKRSKWQKPVWWRKPNPKIRWKHNAWTLECLYKHYQHDSRRAKILYVLKLLCSGISFDQTASMTGEPRVNVVEWAKQYDKNGLKIMLGVSVTIPSHVRARIDAYVEKNHYVIRVLQQLKQDEDFDFYGDEMDVDGPFVRQWILDRNLEGG